jgi:hypothetical protein
MRRLAISVLACLLQTTALADLTGYAQVRQAQRTQSTAECRGVDGCSTMVQQAEVELLYERRLSESFATSVRLDLGYDAAIEEDISMVREAFIDWSPSARWNLRLGRQVLTWGVSEFLYVNDIFPKNFDAFFAGANVDRIKEPIDGVRLATQALGTDLEIVVSRSRRDILPDTQRFAGLAMLREARQLDAGDDDIDAAVRTSRYVDGWDLAAHVASLRSREPRLFFSSDGLASEQPRITQVGLSATGNFAAGVLWLEGAVRDVARERDVIIDRYALGTSFKGIVGYSRQIASDAAATLQVQFEAPLDKSRYRDSLASGVRPVSTVLTTFYLRLERRWMNQTVRAGLQSFVSNEGDTHVNPFVMWSPVDGWTIEGGANLLDGRSDSRFGQIEGDSNVYLLGRYSF